MRGLTVFIFILGLINISAVAESIEVNAEKFGAKVVCYSTYECGYWGGERECEGTGRSKMFFNREAYKKIKNLPSDYSIVTSKSCQFLGDVGGIESSKVPENLQEMLEEKGVKIKIIAYPNENFFKKKF